MWRWRNGFVAICGISLILSLLALWVGHQKQAASAKIELGRYLFYETGLSEGHSLACANCHQQMFAFSDGRKTAINVHGDKGRRNASALFNLAQNTSFTWANPLQTDLAFQALIPLFGDDPIEMAAGSVEQIQQRLASSSIDYTSLFVSAFGSSEINLARITDALAAFQSQLLAYDSRYDRYQAGQHDALTEFEKAGLALFESERFGCRQCHEGSNFNQFMGSRHNQATKNFHNTGLYYTETGYPSSDLGLYEVTFDAADRGKFKTPSLRNVGVSAPYMHDGSMRYLAQVVEHYARGGSVNLNGIKGDGKLNPNKSHLIKGFDMSEQEQNQLVAFLMTLTDETLLTDPRLAKPD
ncbi:MbnH family di-heme enzyme [Motilimonas eburnea]|uniref:MbnH family di-heme enzyme n=1 Tax=Motilimonas eburnea TaxID=1737488 RepID=UPI001E628E56|nr:MbnH family di-heme enzyme [Motilimonas eburnea]MCE2573637.1 di-heme enzyme [Motilimonas eburnea]